MKPYKISVLLCAFILCLTGCTVPAPKNKASDAPKEVYADEAKYYDEYKEHLQYQQLTKEQQRGYGQLYTTIQDAVDIDATISDDNGDTCPGVRVPMNASLTKEEMSHLYESFLKDNPQFFFLDRVYSLEGHEEDGEAVYDTLLIRFTLSLSKRQKAIRQLNEAVEDILEQCPQTDDEYEIEKYFHDYILQFCSYDEAAANSDSSQYEDAYSAYGALVEGRAVCEGYAKAMQLLLHSVSIPATVVMGRSLEDREAHMWNLVQINSAYYYVDVTWDDNDEFEQYTYFNITLESLQRTHQLDDNQLTNLTCEQVTDNYFVRNNLYFSTYDRETIAQAIARRVEQGDTVIQLQFADGKYENALLFLKNVSLTQRMTNNHLRRTTLWDYRLSVNAKQAVITLIKTT